ncbi:hypothetical protein BYT27DRAFT_7163043 [Phlegmacium glaucopus]|nr:hypothetical protein BYT27DRAFT_7163043 [Phlegmacium glaucopus]
MDVVVNTPPPSSPTSKRRSWTTFIPRPGSSSGRPTSSSSVSRNGRPSSSSGWLGGGPSFTLAGFKRSTSGSESKVKEVVFPILSTPMEGKEMNVTDLSTSESPVVSTFVTVPTSSMSRPAVELSRTLTHDNRSPSSSRPSSLMFSLKSPQAPDYQASQPITNAAERTGFLKSPDQSKNAGSFGKSFTSMMGGLSSLSLSRTSTRESYVDDKERGRSVGKKPKRPKSVCQAPADWDGDLNHSTSRARSQSPFSLRRFRTREPSPAPQALPLGQSDADLPNTTYSHSTAFTDDDSGDETVGTEAETDYGSSSDEAAFDIITERNTERNALIPAVAVDPTVAVEIEDPDPVGEGVNVIVAPEPYFPSSLNTLGSRGKRNPRRRKSVKAHEPLPLQTSRPVFQRDRCTITITQGDPEGKRGTRRKRQYVVASDMSQESRYAVEWGIGTVLRDGDEMLIVNVVESESKVDPPIPNAADRTTKIRNQHERQGFAYILVRQVTGLLQRTKLNVRISCQAWHAKNSRHMLLDVVDHIEPTMLIVGSRGLGQLNGILLGSTSHYLIEKCCVPVMVARRRLKRPPKKSAHLSTRRAHVSLAEAGIDRVVARVDQDVQVMREEIQKDDDQRRVDRHGSRDDGRFDQRDPVEEEDPEDENDDDDVTGVKVAGD